jgi:hypothetical protein
MRELRSITFEESESIHAIVEGMRRNREKLPKGQVTSLQLLPEDPPVARLIVTDDYGERSIVEQTGSDLTDFLVKYCMEKRVRLPNSAAKFVEIVDGRLSLFIYMNARDAAKGLRNRLQRPGAR